MTRITLDLARLQTEGKLDADEALRLAGLAEPSGKAGLWINLLLIFGAIAVAGGVLALNPTPLTGLVLALTALGGATTLRLTRDKGWRTLYEGLAIMGALGLSGYIGTETQDVEAIVWPTFLIFTVMTAIAIWFRQAFLAALSVLAFGAMLGSGTYYWHASYALFVREPLISILAFTALAAGLYQLRSTLGEAWHMLLTVAARTAVIMVNFGFWIGSLWGDYPGEHWAAGRSWRANSDWRESAPFIPDMVFTLGWAGALVACILLARKGGFLAVSAIVFLAIHFYTQFFEILGAEPWTLILGGVSAVTLAAFFGRRLVRRPAGPE